MLEALAEGGSFATRKLVDPRGDTAAFMAPKSTMTITAVEGAPSCVTFNNIDDLREKYEHAKTSGNWPTLFKPA